MTLSKAGYARSGEFVAQAREWTGFLIEKLDSLDRARLVEAMDVVQSLLTREPAEVNLRDLRPGDAGWLIQQHAELYQREEGFDHTFEALVAEILADFIKSHNPVCERAFIAERDGQRLGSILCVRENARTARLRLFLLVPRARGLRLGKHLLSECMAFARQAGYREMKLSTHESHRAACALYASVGWQVTDSKPVRSFGVDLVEQSWRIGL